MPMIESVMERAGARYEALDRIAVTRGPGSFTGLRIGLAAAQGLALALDRPVLGIDRFSIYRERAKDHGKGLLIVIDSRRAELFCRYDAKGQPPCEPTMMTAEAVHDFLRATPDVSVTGDIARDLCPERCLPDQDTPESVTCALLAAAADPASPVYLPRPLYIRPPDVTMARAAS